MKEKLSNMYETIYYNDVQYGDVLRLKKKEDCIFQENIGNHVCFFTLLKIIRRLLNAVRQKNGTCNMTCSVMSHLGIVYQSFLGSNCTIVHSSL